MTVKYYLSSSDHVTGPYEKAELVDSFKYGMISPDSTVCEEGSDEWLPISSLTEKKKKEIPIEEKAEIVPVPTPAAAPAAAGPPETPFTELQQTSSAPITVHHNYYNTKSTGLAVVLEVIPGICFFTFGIGNLYAGNIATGLILMFTYWALSVVNFFLIFVLIGLVTWPITFVCYLIFAIVSAQRAVNRSNWQMIMEGKRRLQ